MFFIFFFCVTFKLSLGTAGNFDCALYYTAIFGGDGVSKTGVCKNDVCYGDGEDDLL